MTRQQKVEDLVAKSLVLEVEMIHQHTLSHYKTIKYLSQWWKHLSWVSYGLIVLINLILLFNIDDKKEIEIAGGKAFQGELYLITFFGCLQLIIAIFSYGFKVLEYYPVI
jgi:hypothetical protein